jgi:hypothetical protein
MLADIHPEIELRTRRGLGARFDARGLPYPIRIAGSIAPGVRHERPEATRGSEELT